LSSNVSRKYTGHGLSLARLFLAGQSLTSAWTVIRIFLDHFGWCRFRNYGLMVDAEFVFARFDEILAWQPGVGCGRADAGLHKHLKDKITVTNNRQRETMKLIYRPKKFTNLSE
jgi:hypothetical protein